MKYVLQFTINVRKSHRQPQCVCEDRASWSPHLSVRAAASKTRARNSSLSFVNFDLHLLIFLVIASRNSVVGIATRYGLDGPGLEPTWG
jgi:hypothetical protein